MTLALHQRLGRARNAHDEAVVATQRQSDKRDAYRLGPRGPGRPPDFERHIGTAQKAQDAALEQLKRAQANVEKSRAGLRDLAKIYHPYDLDTGVERRPGQLSSELDEVYKKLRVVANEAELSDTSKAKIEKAARVGPKMVATLRFFYDTVDKTVEALALPEAQERMLRSELIPAAYLMRVAGRQSEAENREAIRATARRLLGPIQAPNSLIKSLDPSAVALLEEAAWTCADLFQRSSSCTEGRNGRLSQWEHAQRRLSPAKLEALTVIHNFAAERTDGTTAAERFFGSKPRNLFDWLLSQLPTPARPARRRPSRRKTTLFETQL